MFSLLHHGFAKQVAFWLSTLEVAMNLASQIYTPKTGVKWAHNIIDDLWHSVGN